MHNTVRSGTLNRNQERTATTRPNRDRSGEGVGDQPAHAAKLGTGTKPTQGLRPPSVSSDSRCSLGGQAGGAGIFGCHGALRFNAARKTKGEAGTPAPLPSPFQGDDPPSRIGGLTFGQRRARISASVAAAAIASRKGHETATAAVPPATAERHTLTIRRSNFAAFLRLSEREVRPVEDVMSEWLADCASLIREDEIPDLHADPVTRTPAMVRAATASNAREEHEWHRRADMIEDGHVHPALVEITLALEGE